MELKYGPDTAPTTEAPQVEFERDPDPGYEQTPFSAFKEKVFGPSEGSADAPKKVTAAVKKDIRAKLAFGLALAPTPLYRLDQVCVEAFVSCIPDRTAESGEPVLGLASALTEIICDSPELVKFFSAGGRYMKLLQLMMALQPFGQVLMQHHITHSIKDEDQEPEDWTAYRV